MVRTMLSKPENGMLLLTSACSRPRPRTSGDYPIHQCDATTGASAACGLENSVMPGGLGHFSEGAQRRVLEMNAFNKPGIFSERVRVDHARRSSLTDELPIQRA
jgi:hypothetical protein